MLKFKYLFFIILISLGLIACSSSTATRYTEIEKEKNTNSEIKENQTNSVSEDFDISPYKIEINVPEKKSYGSKENNNIWYDYGSTDISNQTKSLIGTKDGFRVLVLTTDNAEEANLIKSDEYFSKTSEEIYIDFEPPFYKVKVGDFESQKNAEDLRFKLNQIGYKESKVIKDKINLYK